MMNEVKKAVRHGDVGAIAALLPKIATAIPQARAKVGKYDEQMQGSAQTGSHREGKSLATKNTATPR